VLHFFALSVPDVQVAGGIAVCVLAWPLLTGPASSPTLARASAEEAADWRPRAFYPLTLPVTVGPGSLSVALTLGAHHSGGIRSSIALAAANAIGIALVAGAVYVCYRYAGTILSKLGATGIAVVARLSAFLLLCIDSREPEASPTRWSETASPPAAARAAFGSIPFSFSVVSAFTDGGP